MVKEKGDVELEAKPVDQGFPPILGESPKVLILGTMPSVASMQSNQYYGHPRNAFWWIMSQICGFDDRITYLDRVAQIKKHGIAIWDVVHECHRPGSLDSSIDQTTLQPNLLLNFLSEHSSVEAIGFNGQAAHKLFKKFVGLEAISQPFFILPSTSPANAAMSRENKLEKWLCLEPYLR